VRLALALLLGFRLHAIFAPDDTPRALELTSPKLDERDVGLVLLERCRRHGGETLLGDKGYAGRAFATAVSQRDATFVRPRRKDEPGHGPHLAPIRQRIESIFWTCKDLLTLERHGPAHSPDSGNASSPASAAWPPRSRSTTNSDAPAVHSSTTAPNRAESTI
jgi:hypothetical protein